MTGHPLVLGSARNNMRYRSSGRTRLDTHYEELESLVLDEQGRVTIPLLGLLNGSHSTIPEPVDGTLYVVSGLVAGRIKRADVVAPARIHRGDGGRAEYARALLRYTP